jgi:hypothetical protein
MLETRKSAATFPFTLLHDFPHLVFLRWGKGGEGGEKPTFPPLAFPFRGSWWWVVAGGRL